MNRSAAQNIFRDDVLPGEEILWSGHHPNANHLPILPVLPFLIIGFYVTIGRFIFKKIKK